MRGTGLGVMCWLAIGLCGPTALRFVATAADAADAADTADQAGEPLSFNRDIRPILSDFCYRCHGPDPKSREADLRLDTREGAIAGKTPAVVPGKPNDSELVKRILATDPDAVMPPPHTKRALSASQKQLLQRWIAAGAPYDGHWAFLPVAKVQPPAVKQARWVKNEIDQFILAELERRKIAPAPEADRATLIRRVTLDLTGLLPSPEEVQAFQKDARPDAYAHLVNRLLGSPHYGERWGRHWLDQARYADSNGYSIDSERAMWPYRDWVIRSLNEDLPFTQFTIDQLAGDLLPQPTKLQKLATAFHRNTMINEEGGTDAEQFRNEVVVDRVNTTGAVWLGLTLGCAQCHTHKFDPLSHREYFELFAFFNQGTDINNRGETLEILPGDVLGAPVAEAVDSQTAAEAVKRLEALKRDAGKRQTAWETELAAATSDTPAWTFGMLDRYDAESNRSLQKLHDGSVLADKAGSPQDIYEILATPGLEQIRAIRLEVLPHESLPNKGAGTAGNGNFVLTELEVWVDGQRKPVWSALADHSKKDYPVFAAIDNDRRTGWALEMGKGGQGPHEAWFFFAEPLKIPSGQLTIKLRHDINDNYLIGRFRLSFSDLRPLGHPDNNLTQKAQAVAKKTPKDRSSAETGLLNQLFAEVDHEQIIAARQAEKLSKNAAGSATVMIMRDLEKSRPTYLHLRGDFLNQDKAAGSLAPNTPACLPPLKAASAMPTRLDLARWLVRDDNPLTPRVTVNRIWMQYFGDGLVETDNDFGMQGTAPSHPELLDWLARRFMEQGWSLKQLHRLIVTSGTYRQASHYRPELQIVDPLNHLLSRQNRLRLDAESVRDAALSASGLLDRRVGGTTIRPPQPEGVYAFTQNKKSWSVSSAPERYRRALYISFFRSSPYPLFSTFDAPNFSNVCTRRPRSNTPLQSLQVANDEAFIEFSQALALRLWREVPDPSPSADADRIRRAFQLCASRAPTPTELDRLLPFLQHQLSRFSTDPAAAKAVAPTPRPANLNEPIAASWTALARVLLNTDEFITRE